MKSSSYHVLSRPRKMRGCGIACIIAISFVASGQAYGAVVFTEDWEAENVGDNGNELENWWGSSQMEIVGDAGNKMLRIPVVSGVGGILYGKPSLDVSFGTHGSLLSYKADLTRQPADQGYIISLLTLATREAGGLRDVYSVRLLRTEAMLHRERITLDASAPTERTVFDSLTFDPGTSLHNYELQMALQTDGSIQLTGFIDGVSLLSGIDTNPVMDASTLLQPRLRTIGELDGTVDLWDNVTLSAVPEPSSLAVWGLIGLGFVGRCVRQGRRRTA